jgi:hypothetical protein
LSRSIGKTLHRLPNTASQSNVKLREENKRLKRKVKNLSAKLVQAEKWMDANKIDKVDDLPQGVTVAKAITLLQAACKTSECSTYMPEGSVLWHLFQVTDFVELRERENT